MLKEPVLVQFENIRKHMEGLLKIKKTPRNSDPVRF
jgi:hypothetical protein